MKLKNRFCAFLFTVCWVGIFWITGSIEQSVINADLGFALAGIDLIIILITGIKSGLLSFKMDRK